MKTACHNSYDYIYEQKQCETNEERKNGKIVLLSLIATVSVIILSKLFKKTRAHEI